MSPEMRQMEEQCVPWLPGVCDLQELNHSLFCRFTVYDFRQMKRRSYYPHTQIISTMTATSSTGAGASRPTTPLTPMGDNPPSSGNYEMKEKELPPQDGHDESYDAKRSDAF